MIESRLKINTKSIFARKCSIAVVPKDIAKQFFDDNHIASYQPAKIILGLWYSGELVQCISFSKPRFSSTHEWEIIRLASKMGVSVVGGASKLLAHFIREYAPNSILTYADRRYSNGNVYTQMGFTETTSAAPNYWYFHKSNALKLYHRAGFQKHKLESKLQTFDPNLSEWENMKNNGYDRVWDCGNLVFEMILQPSNALVGRKSST